MTLFISALQSPLAIFKGNSHFIFTWLLYLLLGGIVFGAFGYFLIENEAWLKQQILDYLLPQSWQTISEKLFTFFFESQTKVVLAGMIINGALVLASILLFPLKEYCSATFEKHIDPKRETTEFPLWLQILEEGKLLFFYICAQSLIFAIGYYPYEWTQLLSSSLSVLFLCFSFSLDFISPTLQRHKIKYHIIIRWLTRQGLTTLTFGAIFALPIVWIGQQLLQESALTLAEIASILFAINLFFLALAIPAGTWLAVKFRRHTTPPNTLAAPHRKTAYGIIAAILFLSGGLHYLVGMSMHHKSQLLKCQYSIDWSSFDVKIPTLSNLFKGKDDANIAFTLLIENPTEFDLEIENSIIKIWQNDNLISESKIRSFSVGSGQSSEVPIQFQSKMNLTNLSEISQLGQGWQAYLELELLPGIPLIVELFQTP